MPKHYKQRETFLQNRMFQKNLTNIMNQSMINKKLIKNKNNVVNCVYASCSRNSYLDKIKCEG